MIISRGTSYDLAVRRLVGTCCVCVRERDDTQKRLDNNQEDTILVRSNSV